MIRLAAETERHQAKSDNKSTLDRAAQVEGRPVSASAIRVDKTSSRNKVVSRLRAMTQVTKYSAQRTKCNRFYKERQGNKVGADRANQNQWLATERTG